MKKYRKILSHWNQKYFVNQPWNAILVLFFSVTFSTILMFSTFYYRDHTIDMGGKIWSDFWANIALIRSFSLGDNIPPEYPLFPGERIRYHFLFFFIVGMLERIGVRIDFALNSLSIIGFSGMMIGIYLLTKHISHSRLAGWLAIFLFIFNSSFSWIYYLDKGVDTFSEIVTNKDYGSHGPYDNTVVSGFWKLNVYTNQRHLTFAFTLLVLAIWSIVYAKKKNRAFLGVFALITLSWLHKAVLLIAFLILGAMFLTHSKKRKTILGALLLAGSLAIPGIMYLNGNGITTEKAITYQPGFLYQATDWHEFSFKLTGISKWFMYWFLNFGILPITAVMGWFVLNLKEIKKQIWWKRILQFLFSDQTVWFVLGIVVFAIANLFSFASDLGTNHKFINFSQIIFTVFSAGFLASLFQVKILPLSELNTDKRFNWIKNIRNELWFELRNAGRILVIAIAPILLILLTVGGIFDFFPVFNDHRVFWDDVQKDPVAHWILVNTPPDSIFLNTSYSYNGVTIAGRKVFWGWDYFTMGVGYDLSSRKESLKKILTGQQTKSEICEYFNKNRIGFIFLDTVDKESFLDIHVNKTFFQQEFQAAMINFERVSIIDLQKGCGE